MAGERQTDLSAVDGRRANGADPTPHEGRGRSPCAATRGDRPEPAVESGLHERARGGWFRILTVVNQFTRECLCLVADQSLTGEKVAQVLEPVVMQRGAPRAIIVDNGSEFASRVMDAWACRHGVQLDFILQANRWKMPSLSR
jgi:transposase InsO family protein